MSGSPIRLLGMHFAMDRVGLLGWLHPPRRSGAIRVPGSVRESFTAGSEVLAHPNPPTGLVRLPNRAQLPGTDRRPPDRAQSAGRIDLGSSPGTPMKRNRTALVKFV
jgi:hypothetical protein